MCCEHIPHGAASAANASGPLQTALCKLTRRCKVASLVRVTAPRRFRLSANVRSGGGGHLPTPATPPGVQVRTRRFESVTPTLLRTMKEVVTAGIKQPHYCRLCRPPPGRRRGTYSTRDSKFCLAEPNCRRYYRACAKWSSSRGRNIVRAPRSCCRTTTSSELIVCTTSPRPSSWRPTGHTP